MLRKLSDKIKGHMRALIGMGTTEAITERILVQELELAIHGKRKEYLEDIAFKNVISIIKLN